MTKKNRNSGVSRYAQRIGRRVCRLYVDHNIADACRLVGTTPASFARWLRVDQKLAAAYRRAARIKAMMLIDDMIEIIATEPPDNEVLFDAKAREYEALMAAHH